MLFAVAKTLYQFKMHTKLVDVAFLIMGYKLPWALQYLEQKKKMILAIQLCLQLC